MKKYLYSLLIILGFISISQVAHAEATILPPNPITNVRIETNLKDNPDVNLKNLSMLNSRLYTIVDNDKNLYFCLDESKYYPSGHEYKVDLNEKLSGPVLWLMQTFYQNQNKKESVTNVPAYRDASELTRYAAVQIVIWRFTGGEFDEELITSNPLIRELYNEAKSKPSNDVSYQEVIDTMKNIEINATEIKPNGDDGTNYNYKLQFEDNLDSDMENLFKIDDNETNIVVQLYKHGKTTTITKDVTIEKNYQDRTILINVPKSFIDEDKADDTTIYFNIDTMLTTRQPYYLVFVSSGVQPVGGYQQIERALTARTSIDLDAAETSFSVLKHWEDENNQDGKRPVVLPVQLYQSDKPYSYTATESTTAGNETTFGNQQVLNEENGWEYIWSNLPVEDSQGNKLYYTAREELASGSGYNLTIKDTDEGKALLLINSYKPEMIDLAGTKIWADQNNQDGKRPLAIFVNLLADGEAIQTKVVTERQGWAYQFTNLPKFKNGKEIVYTITENEVPGYSTNIAGTTITNTYTPELTEIKGTKIWEDANNQDGKRPETVTINLLADGVKVDSKEISEQEEWAYSFTNLPKYQEGQEITYTVTENSVPEYSTSIEGTTITNSYTPGKTSMTVTKAWNDANNQDGIRPNSIEVQLYANGKETGEPVELNEANDWTTIWDELAEKEAGKTIVYTVKEVDSISGYDSTINDENNGNVMITNTHTPELTEIKGNKIWEDASNQDGKRPASVTVNLLADGVQVDSKETSEKEEWAYSFTNLPKYQEGQEITYTVTENSVPEYSTTIDGPTITNSYTPGKTSVTVTKAWNDANNQDGIRPNSIEVQLYANGKETGEPVELNEANDWTTTWDELAEKEAGITIAYTVKELGTISDYEITSNDEDKGNITITNTHTPELTEIKGTKIWEDVNNQDGKRPTSVTVNLLADGVQVDSKEISEQEKWAYSFTNLPKYQEGQEITYTVTENSVPEYSTTIDGPTITNSYTPGKTSVTVTKAWNDVNNQDGIRPNSIEVQLYANGKETGEPVELNEANDWTTSWDELAEKEAGKTIVYTVKEVDSVTGYGITIDDENKGNIIITNTHTPELTEIKGTKIWEDANNQDGKRPASVTVNLLADGVQVDSTEISEQEEWAYNFTNLPKYQEGQEITYTVTENSVPEYSASIDGTTITNSYTPGETSVTVTKAWNDANNQDGIRPNSIEVQLYADGKETGEPVELNEANDWTTTWDELAEKEAGKAIVYTVKEVGDSVGYGSTINDENKGNIIITNTHTPELTEIKGNKIWEDANNQDGKRPTSVTVNLLADGVQVNSKQVSEQEEWTYSFTNLPKYQEGQEITYTVTENSVPEYSTSIEGTTITNSYTPGKTSVTVTKAWNDSHNQDGIRSNSIEVQLYANDKKTGESVALSEANNWTTTWDELAEKEAGKVIDYTVKEVDGVSGYGITIDDENKGNIIITNTHTPELTEIKGNKKWEDANNQDGKRPTSIMVNLLADGIQVDAKKISEKDEWAYSFTNLPKYQEGQEITYTVTENTVPEYSTTIDGATITNSYTPGKTSVTVTKAWNDANNQDGIRPDSINVQLYANGKEMGKSVKLNETNNWTNTWDKLAEKEAGKVIDYTVKEVDEVPEYSITINDENKGNIIITNTHTPELTEIKGNKVWDDNDNQDGKRPNSIVVNLLANGLQIDSREISEKEEWAYSFTNLPKYQEGQEITYTVTENTVPEYSTTIDGATITNSYTPGKTSVTVTKAWDDMNDQDGIRPTSIKVQLYANDKKVGEIVELDKTNHWTMTWSDLAEKEAGDKIAYTVEEVSNVNGYEAMINDENKGNIIITNTHQTTGNPKSNDPENTNKLAIMKGNYPLTGEKQTILIMLLGVLLITLVGYVGIKNTIKK